MHDARCGTPDERRQRVRNFATHDLVRVDPAVARAWPDAPAWIEASLARAPWVVVRRQSDPHGIAVGVRGASRAQRYAAWLEPTAAIACASPEEIGLPDEARSPLDRACASVARDAAWLGLTWGPIGAYGFERASATLATHPASDLDVLVRATGVSRATLAAFASRCAATTEQHGVRIDVELAFGDRGIALGELMRARDRVLAKTSSGPMLVPCPV